MQGGGVKINGEKITDFNTTVSLTKEPFILQVGKRKIVKVKIAI
jgi:tyrosyl-tRNA synthetase